MAIIARFSFDVPFGKKSDAFKVMKKWSSAEAEFGFPKPEVLVGSIGAPESRVELNHRFPNLASLEAVWEKLNDPRMAEYQRDLGPFVVPGNTACFGCYEQRLRAADLDYDYFVDQLAGQPPERSSVAFRHSIMSGLIVREIVMYLSGAGDPTSANAVIRVDTDTISNRRMPVDRDPDCLICSGV